MSERVFDGRIGRPRSPSVNRTPRARRCWQSAPRRVISGCTGSSASRGTRTRSGRGRISPTPWRSGSPNSATVASSKPCGNAITVSSRCSTTSIRRSTSAGPVNVFRSMTSIPARRRSNTTCPACCSRPRATRNPTGTPPREQGLDPHRWGDIKKGAAAAGGARVPAHSGQSGRLRRRPVRPIC